MYSMVQPRQKPRNHRPLIISLVFLSLLGAYSGWALVRPLPSLKPTVAQLTLNDPAESKLQWPGSQAAIGIVGTDIVETKGEQKPVPTASTAKVITALLVLEKKPLRLNESGATITLTAQDVERYRQYLAQNGSVLPVQAGQQLTQYQMLQALMLPSANNIADTLVVWAYGSHEAYAKAANQYLKDHGLHATHVGSDASGLAPDTTSTASDMVKISKLAMEHQVIAQIAGQSTATGFPVVKNIKNVNNLLGTQGIIGLKTGNSDQAGGAFLGAAQAKINDQDIVIVTAVLGSPNRTQAMNESVALITSAQANFTETEILQEDTVVGSYNLPWGGSIEAIATKAIELETWNGQKLKPTVELRPTTTDPHAGQEVGQVKLPRSILNDEASVSVQLASTPSQPSIWWRLTHPLP